MNKRPNLRTQLQGAFGILAAASVLGAGSAAWTTSRLNGDMDKVVNGTSKMLDTVGQYSTAAFKARTANRNMLLYGLTNNQKVIEEQIRLSEAAAVQLDQLKVQIQPLLDTPDAEAAFAAADGARLKWFSTASDVVQLCRSGQAEEANVLSQKELRGPAQAFDKAVSTLLEIARRELAAANAKATSTGRWSLRVSFATILVSLLLSVGGFLIIGRISGQLGQTVDSITTTSHRLSEAAAQMSRSSDSLAKASSEQAASQEETSAAAEEISVVSQRASTFAGSASELVCTVGTKLREANESVSAMVASMDEIGESSNKVSKIIRVIDEIAFQTNILALNAAVEAARAGESGLGFAVVADEVRTLAQRSAQAAKDTAELIEDSVVKSRSGRERVERVTATVSEIAASAGELSTLIQDLKRGNEEQATGVAQIASALAEIGQITQSNAAAAEEGASSSTEVASRAESLKAIAQELASMVGRRQ